MTQAQEKDVLEKCIDVVTALQGSRPVGYRAPLYQIRETTVNLLQKENFLYDTSMNAHDSQPYILPSPFPSEPPKVPDYRQPAASWMIPSNVPQNPAPGTAEARKGLVEIPGSWYTEDMTPLGFYPYTPSSHGYVAVGVVEKMWWDRFEWLWENECFVDENSFGGVFPLIWHPESAGRAHIVGMIDKFLRQLVHISEEWGESGEITFDTMQAVAAVFQNSGKS